MSERRTLSFDGCGINGPDEFRTRIATFNGYDKAEAWGPLFEAAPELLECVRELLACADPQRDHKEIKKARQVLRSAMPQPVGRPVCTNPHGHQWDVADEGARCIYCGKVQP